MSKPPPISEEPPDIQRIIKALNALRRIHQDEEDFESPEGLKMALGFGLEAPPEAVRIYKPFTAHDVNELVQDITYSLPIDARSDNATETHNFILRNLFRIVAGEPSFLLPIRDPATGEIFEDPWKTEAARFLIRREGQIRKFPNDPTRYEQASLIISELRRQDLIPKGAMTPQQAAEFMLGLPEFMDEAVLRPTNNLARIAVGIIQDELPNIAAGTSTMVRIPRDLAREQDLAATKAANQAAHNKLLVTASDATIKNVLRANGLKLDEIDPKVLERLMENIRSNIATLKANAASTSVTSAALASGIENSILQTTRVDGPGILADVQREASAEQREKDLKTSEEAKATAQNRVRNRKEAIAAVKGVFPLLEPESYIFDYLVDTVLKEHNDAREQNRLPVNPDEFLPRFRDVVKESAKRRTEAEAATETAEAEATRITGLARKETAVAAVEQSLFAAGITRDQITKSAFDGLVNDVRRTAGAGLDPIPGLAFSEDDVGAFLQEKQTEGAVKSLTTLFTGDNLPAAIRSQFITSGLLGPDTTPEFQQHLEGEVIPKITNALEMQFTKDPSSFQNVEDVMAYISGLTGPSDPAAVPAPAPAPATAPVSPLATAGVPTVVSTDVPVTDPTLTPTAAPTLTPTLTPTGAPMADPTAVPTVTPTVTPMPDPILEDPYDPMSSMIDSATIGGLDPTGASIQGLGVTPTLPGVVNGEDAAPITVPDSVNGLVPMAPGDIGLGQFSLDPEYRARQFGDMPPTPEGDFGLDPFPGMPDNIPASLRTIAEPLYPLEQIMPLLRETAGESPLYLRYLESQIPELQRKYGEERREAFASYNPYGETGGFLPQLREQEKLLRQKEDETKYLQSQLEPGLEDTGFIDPSGTKSRLAELNKERQDIEKGLPTLRRLSGPAGRRYLSSRAPMPTFQEFYGKQLPGIRERYRLTPSGLSDELSQKSKAERTRRRTLTRGKVMVR